jgi:O-antigen/teichoic acid export membrane protein
LDGPGGLMVTSERAATRPAPARTLTKRASLNAVASGLDYGVRAAVELLVTPLMVAGLGPALYGAWRVLLQWSSYVWGASGRSAQALQFAIANRQWTASPVEKRQLVGSAVVVWVLFLPLLLLAGGLGVWLTPTLLNVPPEDILGIRVAAAILLMDAMAVTVLTLPRSALVGENLGYTRMGISTGLVAVGGGLMALAVTADLGLPGVAGAALVTTALTGATFYWITRRRLAWFGIARPTRAMARSFLGLSVWFLGWKFVLELMIASDVIVLALFAPLTLVAAFALTKWVADAMAQALGLLVQATIPGIGGYIGVQDLGKAVALRGEVMSLVWLVGTAVGTTVILWNASFISLWVGSDLYAGHDVTVLVVVLGLQLAFIRADTFIIDVALIPRVKVLAGVVAAVTSVLLAAFALEVLEWGVEGLCLGLIAGRAVLGIVAPVAVSRVLRVSGFVQVRALVRPAMVTAAIFTGVWWAGSEIATESWLLLVAGVAVTVTATASVTWFLGLNRRQRTRLSRRLRALKPRTTRSPS